MRKLVLMATLLAGCGEVTATTTMDSAAADAGVCAPADQVTGRGIITSVVDDPGNVGKVGGTQNYPIRCSNISTLAVGQGANVPLPFGPGDGFDIQSSAVMVTGGGVSPCAYVWTVALVEHDIAPNLGCKWTVTVALSK